MLWGMARTLLILLLATLAVACSKEDRLSKSYYLPSGVWNIKSLERTYTSNGQTDSTPSCTDCGFFLLYNMEFGTVEGGYIGQRVIQLYTVEEKSGIWWRATKGQMEVGTDIQQAPEWVYEVAKGKGLTEEWRCTYTLSQSGQVVHEVMVLEQEDPK